jgi:hypothetical protein
VSFQVGCDLVDNEIVRTRHAAPNAYFVSLTAMFLGSSFAVDAGAFELRKTHEGEPVRWRNDVGTVRVRVEDQTLAEHPELDAIVRAATDEWSGASTLELAGMDPSTATDPQITVRWINPPWPRAGRELAVTALEFDPNDGAIASAVIEINGSIPWMRGEGDPANHDRYDLESTIVHELGHAIGLGHSTIETATMHQGTKPGETWKRTLDQDDISAARAIYDEGGGCSATRAGGDVLAPIALALAAIAFAMYRNRALQRRRAAASIRAR